MPQKLPATLTQTVNRSNFDERSWWYGKEIKKWGDNWPFLSHDEESNASTASEIVWDRYFNDHLGGYPASYRLFKTGVIKYFNVPDVKPEIFDISYEPRP